MSRVELVRAELTHEQRQIHPQPSPLASVALADGLLVTRVQAVV